jgi:hypothetical protein
MSHLALTYGNVERWEEAEALSMHITETKLASINNFASTFCGQGRWMEAEELFVLVMKTVQRDSRPSTSRYLTSIESLTSTYWYQRRWKEAGALFCRSRR